MCTPSDDFFRDDPGPAFFSPRGARRRVLLSPRGTTNNTHSLNYA